MPQVSLHLDENGKGEFILAEDDKILGKIAIGLSGKDLSVYHTEVVPEKEGHGLAKLIMDHLVEYARQNDLQVIPLCSYVLKQFNKTPEMYKDIWTQHK